MGFRLGFEVQTASGREQICRGLLYLVLAKKTLLTNQVNFAGRPFYMLGITGFKVSLCLAYIRLVAKQRGYRRLTWWIMITCVLTHFGGILVLLFQCKPVGLEVLPARIVAKLTELYRYKDRGHRRHREHVFQMTSLSTC